MYLLVAGTMFVFTACNCGAGDAAETDSVEEVVACADDCQKACCLGCKATVGEASCSLLAEVTSCCLAKSVAITPPTNPAPSTTILAIIQLLFLLCEGDTHNPPTQNHQS